jgi:hypothetical protein
MDIKLPWGKGLGICNPKSISLIEQKDYVVSGKKISARSINDNNTYKIKVSETARQNLSYLNTYYNI